MAQTLYSEAGMYKRLYNTMWSKPFERERERERCFKGVQQLEHGLNANK